ncbi:hypothetical protein BH23PAT1_BH23PAT1_0840 [soil metagenome]
MNSKKVFFVMIGLIALLSILAVAGTVLGSASLQKSADKLVELKLENRLLEEQQLSLAQARRDIEDNKELEQIAKTVVPHEKDQARTVREIINLANASGVPIGSITFPSSNLGQAIPVAPPSEKGGTTSNAPAAPSVTQVKPVEGITGVYQLEVNVFSDNSSPVSYEKFINFLERLEKNRRTAQVTNITVQPSQQNSELMTFSLIINVFIKP